MALGALLAFACAFVIWQLARTWRAYRLRARFANAAEGELRARGYLEELGYEILGAQVPAEYELGIDERVVSVRLRADYIVTKNGQRFVAEVKTGTVATQIETAATRRQLLEYRMAFEVDGVILVDADRKRISKVVFPVLRAMEASAGGSGVLLVLLCAAIAAAGAAFWFTR